MSHAIYNNCVKMTDDRMKEIPRTEVPRNE